MNLAFWPEPSPLGGDKHARCYLFRNRAGQGCAVDSRTATGVDRIVEVDFAANVADDFAMVAAGGDIVVYGSGQPDIPVPFVPAILKNVQVAFFIVYHLSPTERARAVQGLTALLQRGDLQHNIAARLPLERIADAHELVESGRNSAAGCRTGTTTRL